MSRIGKRPVAIPSGVTASVEGQTVKVKGPKGQLQFVVHDDVEVKFADGQVTVAPRVKTNRAQAMYGTARAQVANLVEGVTKGFEKKLEITGVGYRAAMQGKNLQLALGFSHDVVYQTPEGITIATPKPTEITVTGIDKQQVGQVAAEQDHPREVPRGEARAHGGEVQFRPFLLGGLFKAIDLPGRVRAERRGAAATNNHMIFSIWPKPRESRRRGSSVALRHCGKIQHLLGCG